MDDRHLGRGTDMLIPAGTFMGHSSTSPCHIPSNSGFTITNSTASTQSNAYVLTDALNMQ